MIRVFCNVSTLFPLWPPPISEFPHPIQRACWPLANAWASSRRSWSRLGWGSSWSGSLAPAVNADTRRVYVANQYLDTISVIDEETNTVAATISMAVVP